MAQLWEQILWHWMSKASLCPSWMEALTLPAWSSRFSSSSGWKHVLLPKYFSLGHLGSIITFRKLIFDICESVIYVRIKVHLRTVFFPPAPVTAGY